MVPREERSDRAPPSSSGESLRAALGWFVVTRAFAAICLLVLLLGLKLTQNTRYDLYVPIALCAVELLANGLWAWWRRRDVHLRALAHAQFIVDILCITTAILATGGVASPFLPAYTIVVLSAGLLSLRYAVTHGLLCALTVLGLEVAHMYSSQFATNDDFIDAAVVGTNVTLLLLTSVLVSFFRAQTQSEKERLREVSDTLRRAYDELKAYEQQQRDLNQHLQQSMRAKSEFMALMSHELRTPLNSVIGFADLMLDPAVRAEDGERKNFLEHIGDAGRHLLAIIDNIIDMSRLDVDGLQSRLDTVNVAQVVEESCGALARAASGRGVQLVAALPERLPDVIAEPRRMRQVLGQLVDNALDFTPAGGTIRIEAFADDGFVRFEVSDTGRGIPAEHLEKVFEPFHQVDSSTTRRHGGTGLGLALARAVVHVQGGRIWAESTVGAGTTICFTLPAAPNEEPLPNPPDGSGSIQDRSRAVTLTRGRGPGAGP